MESLIPNAIRLPDKLSRRSPEDPWFDKEASDWRLVYDCRKALIAEGIGERECPSYHDEAAFAVAGAVIAALTGRYIYPPRAPLFDWHKDQNHCVWEALWQAFLENETKLDRTFMAAMLRDFLPRYHYAPPDHPYYESYFVARWPKTINTVFCPPIENLHLRFLKEGHEAMQRLPEATAASVRTVAGHIPKMLEVVIAQINASRLI
jgi:hypothetical protein